MTDLLELITFDTPFAWILFLFAFFIICLVPKFFGLRVLNGLLFSQATLLFNSITMAAGLGNGLVSLESGIHFFILEFSFFIAIYVVYAKLIQHRVQINVALNNFFSRDYALVLISFVLLIAFFNYAATPIDGSSRIKFMTEAWFSLIKPFIQIANALSYLGIFIMLLNPQRRRLGYLLLVLLILGNVFSGSKASFVFNLLAAFLALRDLSSAPNFQIRTIDKIKLSLFVLIVTIIALNRLSVSLSDVKDRFFLFGEANILTYFSDKPTAACENLSIFAKIHRGWARLAGDSSANNVDTLFGYALMIEATGVNTFTGPNARLSAYGLCNFPGEAIMVLVVVVLSYLGLILMLAQRLIKRSISLAIFYPYFIVSLAGAAQDFNLIMQDITIYCVLLFITIPIYAKTNFKFR